MKYLNLLIILTLAFAFGACGGAATSEKKADDQSTTGKKETTDEKKAETKEASTDSPTQAVKDFVAAYKAKDVQALKKRFSKVPGTNGNERQTAKEGN